MKKTKYLAWEFYNNWRKETTYCPALKTEIVVSLLGWKHITDTTGSTKRSTGDVFRRLKLLPHAKNIIRSSATIQSVRQINGKRFYALEQHINLKRVRVILLEDDKGRIIFYSVMN